MADSFAPGEIERLAIAANPVEHHGESIEMGCEQICTRAR